MKWYYKCVASISLNSKTELYKRFNVYFNKSLTFIPNPMQLPLQQSCLLFCEVEEIRQLDITFWDVYHPV